VRADEGDRRARAWVSCVRNRLRPIRVVLTRPAKVCAACLETQQPSRETSEPYRELVHRMCEELRSYLGEWIGSTCCDSICVWEVGSCSPSTLCCGGIPCQGGICTE
jgi:hypothetical protein